MGKRYSIVLIEDNEGDALLVDEMLKDTGLEHDLSWFLDGPSAERYFSEGGDADLILVDLHLPGTRAQELISALRRHGVGARTAIAAFTGSTSPEDIERAREAGMERYLIKPMGLEEMEETSMVLRQMLQQESGS